MTTTDNPLPANLQPQGDICIPLFVPDNQEWLWYVIKCLSFPTAKRFWKKERWEDVEIMRREWDARVYQPFLEKAMQGITCPETGEGDCIEYNGRAGFISWFPINPFYDSSIPSGYVQPPFFLWQNILPSWIPDFIEDFAVDQLGFTGYEDNDVLTMLWCFPFFMNWFNEFSGGFPRFTVKVQGEGSVELHLLNVPLGGRCLITVDVEFNPLDIINGLVSGGFNMAELNKDVFAAPPELETVHIVEIPLTDDIEHTIHVTFIPTVNARYDFINFGGGLRKVVLCGVIPIEETTMDCIDILDCIDIGDNDTARYIRTSALGLAGGVWTFLGLQIGATAHEWESPKYALVEGEIHRIEWLGEEVSKHHVSANVRLASGTASTHGIRIVHEDGTILAQQFEIATTVSSLNIDTDVQLAQNEYVYVQVFTGTAGSVSFTDVKPTVAIHRIDKTGATGAQGNPGIPGNEGSQGTVPPIIEYLFVEQIFENTQEWLDDLETQYTDSPQDIDPDIPIIAPDDIEAEALCKALAAWMRLYVEAKKARLRGLSLLHQVWEALTDAMGDIYYEVVNIIGWNPLPNLFGCSIDNQTAIAVLDDEVAINQYVCCLWSELKDIALLTTSLEGAVNACAASLAGNAGDIACMVQGDLNLEHTLNFYYLYGRALSLDLASICPCATQSYIEYDFTVSDWGFTSINGTWVNGVGWVGTVTEPSSGNYRARITITKEFLGALPIGWAGGMVFDALANCGIQGQLWEIQKDGLSVGLGQIGNVTNGDNQHRVWTRSTSTPYQPVAFDTLIYDVNPACCGCGTGKGIITKARVWLDGGSPVQGIETETYPQGLPPNGSSSLDWWQ